MNKPLKPSQSSHRKRKNAPFGKRRTMTAPRISTGRKRNARSFRISSHHASDLAAVAGVIAECDQSAREPDGRAVPVADQNLAGREGSGNRSALSLSLTASTPPLESPQS